jgi:hypothetical protein
VTQPAPVPETSIDDLLSHDAEEPRQPRGAAPRFALWALKAILGAAALAGALVLVLRAVGFDLWYPLAVAGILALLALQRVVSGLRAPPVGPLGGNPSQGPEPAEPDQLVAAVQRWQTRISWGRAGIRPFTRTSPLLAELVDERLRLRLGLTMATDPVRARTLVGERLWSYLADPAAPTPSRRDLAALLTDVEKL